MTSWQLSEEREWGRCTQTQLFLAAYSVVFFTALDSASKGAITGITL